MEELSAADLVLFFDDELYLINEPDKIQSSQEAEVSEVKEPVLKPLSLNYKGGNAKGIVILANEESTEFFNDADETLLLNILKAIGFSLEDVAIINQHYSGIDWIKQLTFTKVIAFGIDSNEYQITIEKYTIHTHQNVKWLFSDSLTELASDKILKANLWGKLQELF